MSGRGYSILGVVSRAYGFTFGNPGRLALVALPMFLVLTAITFVMTFTAPPLTKAILVDIPQAGAAIQLRGILYGLFAAIPALLLITGLYRAYFNPEARAPYVWSGWLPLRTLWTTIVYYFFFVLTALIVILGAVLVFGLLSVLGDALFGSNLGEIRSFQAPAPYMILGALLGGAFVVAAGVYVLRFLLRYSLFLPHTVHENRVRPREAWLITRGHAVSLFLAYLIGLFSFSILLGVITYAIKAGFSIAGAEPMVWLLTLAEGEAPAASPDREWLPVLLAAAIVQVLAILSTTFSVGLMGAAYDGVMGRLNALQGR